MIRALLLAATLSGCAMVHRYEAPDGRPEALVSFVARDDDAAWSGALYWVDPARPCSATPSIALVRGESDLIVSSPTVWNLPIEARDPVQLRAELRADNGTRVTCSGDLKFAPVIDGKYKVDIDGRGGACRIALSQNNRLLSADRPVPDCR